jgi:hypothetical protein
VLAALSRQLGFKSKELSRKPGWSFLLTILCMCTRPSEAGTPVEQKTVEYPVDSGLPGAVVRKEHTGTYREHGPAKMVSLYLARLADLGPGDFA